MFIDFPLSKKTQTALKDMDIHLLSLMSNGAKMIIIYTLLEEKIIALFNGYAKNSEILIIFLFLFINNFIKINSQYFLNFNINSLLSKNF